MITLYGIDPGQTTGFVQVDIVDREFIVKNVQHWNVTQVNDWYTEMLDSPPAILIIEDYIIQPRVHNYSHEGDKGIALRLIGGAQFLCHAKPQLQLELQGNFRKPTGYGMLGAKYVRGKKGQHSLDALAHVMYYAAMNKLADPIAQVKDIQEPSQKRSGPRIFRTVQSSQWRRPDKEHGIDIDDKLP